MMNENVQIVNLIIFYCLNDDEWKCTNCKSHNISMFINDEWKCTNCKSHNILMFKLWWMKMYKL